MKIRDMLLLVTVFLAAGCAHQKADEVKIEPLAPPVTEVMPAPAAAPGSLWSEDARMMDIYSDSKARRVGDIVIVQIVESASANKEAKSEADRTNKAQSGVTSFFGIPLDKSSIFGTDISPTVEFSTSSEFDGEGKTSRKGDVSAVVAARVTRILPSGNMLIEGKKQIRVNSEVQYILLSGIVRPSDISPNNTTMSTYVSDLKLDYYGAGLIGDQQKRGWLSRVADKVWPF